MSKISFKPPPILSPAHASLRSAVAGVGLNATSLRRLMWLFNAHPRLKANAKVFKHIGDHLSSRRFEPENLVWAGAWTEDIPSWQEICRWIWSERRALSALPGLHEFDKEPASEDDHPHLGEGAVRHGVAAALWSIHGSIAAYPPPDDATAGAASAYFALQGHLLAAYLEARLRMSTLEFYESYDEPSERPIAPMRTSGVSPAVREFSLPRFAALVTQMPRLDSTREFAEAFDSQHFLRGTLPDADRARANQYIQALRRYFHRYLRMLEGWRPNQSVRPGWGGDGGHVRRPGFVHFEHAPGVYFEEPVAASDDKELPRVPGQRVFIDRDPENNDQPRAVEESGLAPNEAFEPIFNLFTAEEMRGRLLALSQQRLAVEMRAQSLPFDYCNLTPQELHDLWSIADKRIQRYLRTGTDIDDVRQAALASLIIKFSLCFGQPLSAVQTLGVEWQVDSSIESQASIGSRELALVLRAPGESDWGRASLVGMRLPAIMPTYKTELPDDLADMDREFTQSFVLPDLFSLGGQLIGCLRIRPPPAGRVFGIQADSLKRAVKDMLSEARNKRITTEKIASTLPSLVTSMTGDQSLAWLMTADRTHGDEPRMHYTRHTVELLQANFQRAARRLARCIGVRIPGKAPVALKDKHKRESGTVGARFVLAHDELRELVTDLSDELKNRYIDRADSAQQVSYHNRYMAYTILFQTLATSLRVTTKPTDLYEAWRRRADRRTGFIAALSDKGSFLHDKDRLVHVSAPLAEQFEHFRVHEKHVVTIPGIWLNARTLGKANRPFFFLTEHRELETVGPGWLAKELRDITGFAIPANFARAYLRTELLARGCPASVVDAFLGHANQGEIPFATYSTFDFGHYRERLSVYLEAIREELGLQPIASRLAPYSVRAQTT